MQSSGTKEERLSQKIMEKKKIVENVNSRGAKIMRLLEGKLHNGGKHVSPKKPSEKQDVQEPTLGDVIMEEQFAVDALREDHFVLLNMPDDDVELPTMTDDELLSTAENYCFELGVIDSAQNFTFPDETREVHDEVHHTLEQGGEGCKTDIDLSENLSTNENIASNAILTQEVEDDTLPDDVRPRKRTLSRVMIAKKKREKGVAYQGRKKGENGNWDYSIPRPPKTMKSPCNCKLSRSEKTLKCNTIIESQRQKMFSKFWKNMSWYQKSTHISTLVDVKTTKDHKHRKNKELSRRKISMTFHLQTGGEKARVCKRMFLNTLGITDWFMHKCVMESLTILNEPERDEELAESEPSKPNRKRRQSDLDLKKMNGLRDFLRDIQKMESHYCRKNTKKLFLEPIYQKKTEVYAAYKQHCLKENLACVTLKTFYLVFHEMNLSIYVPRKDQCDVCVGFDAGTVGVEKYQLHQKLKETSRNEKEADECAPNNIVFTMDTQGVLLCPRLKASAQYYKMKLAVHNFTVFNKKTKDVTCYVWHEGEGGVSSNEFSSMIVDFLSNQEVNEGQQLILWSDGCGYQNRNANLSGALLLLSQKMNVTIIQKYLEKGHTQMECDSIHSLIERKLKNKQIYIPAGYVDVISSARIKPSPYEVKYLDHSFFKDYSKMNVLSSIRPGSSSGDPTVNDIRAVKYCPSGQVFYKLQFEDEWNFIPRRNSRRESRTIPLDDAPPLFKAPPKIKPDKFKHLQELRNVIATDYHYFYEKLNH